MPGGPMQGGHSCIVQPTQTLEGIETKLDGIESAERTILMEKMLRPLYDINN